MSLLSNAERLLLQRASDVRHLAENGTESIAAEGRWAGGTTCWEG